MRCAERPRSASTSSVCSPTVGAINGVGGRSPSMAPTVGEQTDEVLADLGLSAERIAELRAAGVVGPR